MDADRKRKMKKRRLIACVLLVIVILIVVFTLFNSKSNKKVDLEGKMTTMVSSFYDKNIKGKIVGVHKQIVTLKDLQNQEYDISDFVDAKCSLDSFAYVILKDPKEIDATKIKYTVENHLDCK